MNVNIGGLDRSLRIIAGLLLLDLVLGGIAGRWAWLGLLPLLTGAAAWCPLYVPLHFTTVRTARAALDMEALRRAIPVHAHSTVRPRTFPDRNSSMA